MRKVILGLSFIFFALSGIVLFKTLTIPVDYDQQQNYQAELKTQAHSARSEEVPEKPLPHQEAESSAVRDIQASSVSSGDEVSDSKSEPLTNDRTSGTRSKARVLAVIGAGSFNAGQILLEETLISTIKEVVPDILAAPEYQVYVEGHTDDMPVKASDKRYADNMELSFLRAKAVASILVENGISLDRISVTGYGESRPIASNESDEGRIKNRRVEIKLVPEDKEL